MFRAVVRCCAYRSDNDRRGGGQLSGTATYEAEPVDVWGIGVILFTLLAGSASHPRLSSFIRTLTLTRI